MAISILSCHPLPHLSYVNGDIPEVHVGAQAQDFMRVTEGEGEEVIDYYAVFLPCCVEGWGIW